ncbi:GTPase-activating protein S13 [Agyrium rufum]|nr:GTPase-activating protein S13 [Agyrium rufum]
MLENAHGMGVNSVSWAPAGRGGGLYRKDGVAGQGAGLRRFVSGGSDCLVKIWDWNQDLKTYTATLTLSGHTDWVRDVSWSPSTLSLSYIASASQDKSVRIWTAPPIPPNQPPQSQTEQDWKCTVLGSKEFDAVVWRVSWSLSGNVLAVSGGDNKVSLWKEGTGEGGGWGVVKWVEE